MRIYYRDPDVLITDAIFVRRTEPRRAFLIRGLQHVVLIRGDLDPARSTTAHVAGGALVLVAASWPMLHGPTAYTAAALVVAVPAAVSLACSRMLPRSWEIRADYEGQEVVLYTSADARIFNQIGRGLRRAIEDADQTSAYGLAGGSLAGQPGQPMGTPAFRTPTGLVGDKTCE